MAEFGAEHIDLSQVQFTPELLAYIPAEMARKYRVLPVFQNDTYLSIAFADPADLNAMDSLCHYLNRRIEVRVADKSQLKLFIERLYPKQGIG